MDSLLDLAFPEECVVCGARRGEVSWAAGGLRTAGLRFWDTPHLCRTCEAVQEAVPVFGALTGPEQGALAVVAAGPTNNDLVGLVGQFKYQGIRGLAWPLIRMLHQAFLMGENRFGPVGCIVPVALHRRRQRERGFNQAEILTHGLCRMTGKASGSGILVRGRSTGQQAKLSTAEDRQGNLWGAFRARSPEDWLEKGCRVPDVCLVDDLVTSGWTVMSAAAALRAAGWPVVWVLALGLSAEARNPGLQVDTRESGF